MYAVIGVLAALSGAPLIGCGPAPPDIALITFDTLRWDRVGANGSSRGLTPNLDALAARGLVYGSAFTTMPTTAPAHVSLFSGLLPYQHGVRFNGAFLSVEAVHARNLASRLRKRGYATACFTSAPVFGGRDGSIEGFDQCDLSIARPRAGAEAVRAAVAWMEGHRGGPMFVWVHLFDPHSPYGEAREKIGGYPVDPDRYGWVDRARFGTRRSRRRVIAAYDRGVRAADAAFGELMRALGSELRNTLVIAVADHGEALDERLDAEGFAFGHGPVLGDDVLRIPLVLAGAGVEPGRTHVAVSIRDLYTTILSASGNGDPTAAAEGRIDLRRAPTGRRIVTAERRSYATVKRTLAHFRPGAAALIARNAVAATDGEHLVVLAEDGSPSLHVGDVPQDVLAAARAHHAESFANPSQPAPQPLDPVTRARLHELGYVE